MRKYPPFPTTPVKTPPSLRTEIQWSEAAREINIGTLKYVTMEALMRQAARATFFLAPSLFPLPESKDTEFMVDINVVDDAEIKELNHQYRGKNQATDVLAFAQLEEQEAKSTFSMPTEKVLLGDILISLATAQQQAEQHGHPLPEEMAFLTAHAMLHLLGYDHMNATDKKAMWKQQSAIMERVCKWPTTRRR